MQAKCTWRVRGISIGDTAIMTVPWLSCAVLAKHCQMTHSYSSSEDTSHAAAQEAIKRHYDTSSAQSSSTHVTFSYYSRLRPLTKISGAMLKRKPFGIVC